MASDAAMAALAAALLVSLLAAGCATPVGVKRIRPEEANRQLTASVLTTGEPGAPAQEFLYRLNLIRTVSRGPGRDDRRAARGTGTGRRVQPPVRARRAVLRLRRARRRPFLLSRLGGVRLGVPVPGRSGIAPGLLRSARPHGDGSVQSRHRPGIGQRHGRRGGSQRAQRGAALRPAATGRGSVRFRVRWLPARRTSRRWRISRFADCATATAAAASARRSPPRWRRARGAWIRGSGRTSRCPSPRCSASTIRAAA